MKNIQNVIIALFVIFCAALPCFIARADTLTITETSNRTMLKHIALILTAALALSTSTAQANTCSGVLILDENLVPVGEAIKLSDNVVQATSCSGEAVKASYLYLDGQVLKVSDGELIAVAK